MTAIEDAQIESSRKGPFRSASKSISKLPTTVKVVASALVGTCFGFYLEVGLEVLHEKMYPDPYKTEAIRVRTALSEKADTIQAEIGNLSVELASLRDGGSETDMRVFIERASALVSSFNEFSPALQQATTLTKDLEIANRNSKAAEFEVLGFSKRPDFVLQQNESVSLCDGKATFGLASYYSNSSSVFVNLSATKGSAKNARLAAGERIAVDQDGTLISVTSAGGPRGVTPRQTGFNFSCDAVENEKI